MIHKLTILITVVLVLASCGKEEPTGLGNDPTHVLLVYVGTDNNLSGYEQAKIQGLRDGWTGRENDRIIVYRDTKGTGARLMEVSNLGPGDSPRIIAEYSSENSASSQTLNRVITDVIGMYPTADSYGLLVFSHASGWLPQGTLYNPNAITSSASYGGTEPLTGNGFQVLASATAPVCPKQPAGDTNGESTRSIIIDGSQEMELASFAAAIPDGVFDYIVFEACFMAGIEVAYELRHKTPVILASSAEILHPGFAPVYPSATAKLIGQDLAAFGQGVFNHTLTYAEGNIQRSATYSVINTTALDGLCAFVRENCDLSRAVAIEEVQHFDRLDGYRLFFDLEDYYGSLLDTDAQRAELSRLVADCVVWKAATDKFMTQQAGYNGFEINRHSGLTAYIPQAQFAGLNMAYANLGWTKAIR